MADASADVTAGKRLIFLSRSRERGITGDGAGIFDLEVDGARLFLNAVSYMTGSPIVELPPLLKADRPSVGATQYYAPLGMALTAASGNAGGIPATNITLTLNGKDVTASLTIGGTPQARSISYGGLVANTNYTGALTVKDARGLQSTLNLNFDTLPPFTLPAAFAYPTNAATVASPGMQARIAQAYDYSTLVNSSDRAESQLAGTLVDPDTAQPFPNLATPSTDNPNGAYNQQTINWSVNAGGVEIGNFQGPTFPDQLVPGVAHTLNFTAEVVTYLELTPGRHLMGVNSDDGFVVYTGAHPRDAFAVALGRFDGGRGSADTTFQFEVSEAGLYPFRVVYYQGTGDGNLEWFTVVPETGEKILVNDRNNPRAVRAWRQLSVPERPYVVSLQPSPGQIDVDLASNVTVKLQDAGAQVQEGTVRLTINGQTVSAQATKANGVTTVVYDPAQNLPSDTKHAVALTYTDSASNQRTVNYEFTTKFVPPTQKGANIVWVSFHAEDNQPSAAAVTAGFTNASDVAYTQLLRSAGHTVTRYLTTAAPDPAFLNTFDLVILSRAVPSGNYQTADSTLAWHSITKPTMVLGGYITRASRLGYTTGDTIPDTGTTNNLRLKINAPSHPIFSGIQVDAASNMVNAFAHRVTFNGVLQRGISVNSNPIIAGGTVLATIGTQGDAAFGGMVIGEYPAGTKMGNPSADVTAGKRLVFLTGSRENDGLTSEGAGIFDLDGDGSRMFLNAVRYMAGLVDETPAKISISATLSANGVVVSWPETGSEGFVLQTSPTLSAANWQPVAGNPTVSNGRRTITIPATGTSGFLRLAKP